LDYNTLHPNKLESSESNVFTNYLRSVPMRRGGSLYKLPGSGGPEGGPEPGVWLCCIYFCLSRWYHCRLYKLTL